MADIALIVLVIGFFGLCLAYINGLDRMIHSADDSLLPGGAAESPAPTVSTERLETTPQVSVR